MRDNYCYESCVNGHCPLIIERKYMAQGLRLVMIIVVMAFLDVILVGF